MDVYHSMRRKYTNHLRFCSDIWLPIDALPSTPLLERQLENLIHALLCVIDPVMLTDWIWAMIDCFSLVEVDKIAASSNGLNIGEGSETDSRAADSESSYWVQTKGGCYIVPEVTGCLTLC